MSHTVVITKKIQRIAATTDSHAETVDYTFSFEPSHADNEAEVGDKVAKILKHLKKAEAIANGHDHE